MDKLKSSLNWLFTLIDRILDKAGFPNNAGDIKFRTNVIVGWFVFWGCFSVFTSGGWDLVPLSMTLWGGAAWYKPMLK